jgi:hypothetical protein
MSNSNRRQFLSRAAAGASLAGLAQSAPWGDSSFLAGLPPVSAAESEPNPEGVTLRPEIEPLVRLLETTPRDRLLEEVAARIRAGTAYEEVLAALLLAGVRNVEPRPSVGFKFHSVLVVNSAHLASLGSPPEHRWLPIFWALDYFKDAQAQDDRERGWTMGKVNESAVPAADKAEEAFVTAMENWDVQAADAAVAGLARTSTPDRVFELFYRLGCRDFRDIGHKAIFVANSQRTLSVIGWQHAEPVLRSLAYALLQHEGDNPARRDADADRPGRRNKEWAGKLKEAWRDGRLDDGATRDLLGAFRSAPEEECCKAVMDAVNRGVSPQSVWDALLVGAGELVMRQPAIVSLHAVTSTNALRYAYGATTDDSTRRLLLLQNAAFVPLFREAMARRGDVKEARLDQLEASSPEGTGAASLDAVFGRSGSDKLAAARSALGFLNSQTDAQAFIDRARLLVFFKGTNSHDYKFSSAVLEDYAHASPGWRERYLSSSLFLLHGDGDRENPLAARTRAALS